MPEIAVGLIGFGTVGTGVVKILKQNANVISRRLGAKLYLKKIADVDLKKDRGIDVEKSLLTTNASEIIADPEIKIVIELIGGYDPARQFILDAVNNGKYVVTANKALLATRGAEIFAAAAKRRVEIGMEASVGGGIPIIRSLKEGLAANRVISINGIINGTANFILSKMAAEEAEFTAVLKEAQALGYAEADPSFDVDGIDAAHKLAIMIAIAFGTPVNFDDIYTEGISHITPLDIRFAAEFGYRIKLLAITKNDADSIEARVHPTMLPENAMLAKVNGVLNAIAVTGDALGTAIFLGRGAGMMPTASAVVSDVIEMARLILAGTPTRVPPLGFTADAVSPIPIKPIDDLECPYYIRIYAEDEPGVLAQISRILGEEKISIASVIQKGRQEAGAVPIVMRTHEAREANLQKAIAAINRLSVTKGDSAVIRIEPHPEEGLE